MSSLIYSLAMKKLEILFNYLISTKTQNYTIIVIIILYSR